MIYNYKVIRKETKHYSKIKDSNGKYIPVGNGLFKHRVNKELFNVVHCLSGHPQGVCQNKNGGIIRAFKNTDDAISFLQKNDLGVSADVLILPDGTRIEYYVDGIPDNEVSMNHAGISEWKGEKWLNSKSRGAELFRMAERVPSEQYTIDQYKSLADYFYHKNHKPFKDDHVTHEQIAPGRKTDPDFFDMELYWEEYKKVWELSIVQ